MEDDGQEIFPMGDTPDLLDQPIGTPGDQAPPPAQDQKPPAPEGPWWKEFEGREIEYNANGKVVKEPFSKLLQRASMGYNYAQVMGDFNRQKAEFEERSKAFESDASWKEIVEYAKQDKEWAEHTRQSFERRGQWRQENADNPLLQDFNRLKSEIEPLKKIADSWQKEREAVRIEKENQALDSEIKQVAEKYSKFGVDINAIDPQTGLSLESTVVDYAVKNGIKSFKTAFLEVYADKLESMREEALKAQWAKEQAAKAKQGFIGRTPTPQLGSKTLENPGSMSWDDVARDAISAIKAGQY